MTESIIVVKLGGTEGVDFSAICADAADLLAQGQKLVFVHGGSAEANALGEALGTPPKFITSPSGYTSRYTNRETLEVFLMAVNGKVNSLLTEQLHGLGINAFGLSGIDGGLMVAARKDAIQSVENGKRKIIRDDYTGKIESVNSNLLLALLEMGYLPVIAPVAVSQKGEALNVDADRAAAMVASALEGGNAHFADSCSGADEKLPGRVDAHPATAAESAFGGVRSGAGSHEEESTWGQRKRSKAESAKSSSPMGVLKNRFRVPWRETGRSSRRLRYNPPERKSHANITHTPLRD